VVWGDKCEGDDHIPHLQFPVRVYQHLTDELRREVSYRLGVPENHFIVELVFTVEVIIVMINTVVVVNVGREHRRELWLICVVGLCNGDSGVIGLGFVGR
jgi:hypothetical protein